jgi:hypothetical protein
LVEEAGGLGENLRPVAIHWQTLSHNVVHLALIEIRPHNISGDCIGSCKSNYYTITATTAHVISCNVKKAETIIKLKTKKKNVGTVPNLLPVVETVAKSITLIQIIPHMSVHFPPDLVQALQ